MRTTRRYGYTNEDGETGFVSVDFGPWGGEAEKAWGDAPIMVTFDDARWMGIEQARGFQRWLRVALAEAERLHVPREEGKGA